VLQIQPPIPANEEQRLEALWAYQILDTPPEPDFDELLRLAVQICHAPVALITFIDAERQWFKAKFGIDTREMSRNVAFCAQRNSAA
jgi:hypothetical protein